MHRTYAGPSVRPADSRPNKYLNVGQFSGSKVKIIEHLPAPDIHAALGLDSNEQSRHFATPQEHIFSHEDTTQLPTPENDLR